MQQELADTTLETRVKLALYGAVGLDAQQIDVEAAAGTVSLVGSLSSSEEKAEALAAAESIDDVIQVIDMIQVVDPVITEVETE